jgi:hypothetical protein
MKGDERCVTFSQWVAIAGSHGSAESGVVISDPGLSIDRTNRSCRIPGFGPEQSARLLREPARCRFSSDRCLGQRLQPTAFGFLQLASRRWSVRFREELCSEVGWELHKADWVNGPSSMDAIR